MNGPSPEMVELFLQEASEHLQFLREYSGILQDPYPLYEDIERLYISAHGVAGTGGTYGYTLFHEVAGKLAHIFQYAMNATISPEATAPLVEFIYEGIAVLESDLIMIAANSEESVEDIASFKQRYPFAFQGPPPVPVGSPTEQPHPPQPETVDASDEPLLSTLPPQMPVAPNPPVAGPVAPPARAVAPVVATARPPAPVAPPLEAVAETIVPLAAPPVAPPSAPVEKVVAEFEEVAETAAPVEPVAARAAEVAGSHDYLAELRDYVVEPMAPAAAAVPAPTVARVEEIAEPLEPVVAPAEKVVTPVEEVAEPSEPVAEVAAAPLEQIPEPEVPIAEAMPAPPVAPPPTPAEVAAKHLAEVPQLAADREVPDEVLEFFIPEVEEHLQTITDSLLALEARPNEEDINRIFRAIHTIKGSAAQVGWQRIATIAHRAEDVMGRLRDGELKPSATIIDLCLETVDVIKRLIYRQWEDEAGFQLAARSLIARMEHVTPAEDQLPEVSTYSGTVEAAPPPLAEPAPASLLVTPAVPPLVTQPVAEPVAQPVAQLVTPVVTPAVTPLATPHVAPVSNPLVPPAPPLPTAALEPLSPLAALLADATAGPIDLAATMSEPKLGAPEPMAAPTMPVGMAQSKSVRIGLERLDRMMNAVGELVINRTRMLGRLAELEKLAEVLNFSKGRMSDKVTEFQDKYEFSRINSAPLLGAGGWGQTMELGAGGYPAPPSYGGFGESGYGNSDFGRPIMGRGGHFDYSPSEFSELEMDRYDDFGILSRSLTEISADISEVLTQLDGFVRRVDGDIDEFTKLAHRLQDEITQARMVPIGNLFTRIARTVRDAAKASNKQVDLALSGAETELDNNIIQQIADPLLHLVRNAVAHGIERAEERYEGGKADRGNIAVRAYHRGNHIFVEVEDDGRGVDLERVKAAAVEGGFVSADKAERLGRREILDLLFLPGFSTAPRRTELAGRGVGLDVVHSNVANLNGEIEIETEKGIGTRFTLKVPLTLIISQALFVRCGEQVFAFPLGFVEEIRRIRPSEIEDVSGKLIAKVRDVLTEVVRFDDALQLPPLVASNGYLRLVLVNVGGRQVGVVVEEVLRKDEIVIKNLGEYLRHVKLFPGATIAPDGSLILLVDVNRLIMGEYTERRPLTTAINAARLFLPGATAVARGEIPAAAIDRVEREKLVVLADDSISVRKFVGRMLEKAGYRVKLAADGLEALEIATSNDCDLVITDLEMPRTNGYELMLHLRQTPSTSKVPVMVVTSRAGAKHRERALKEGAAAFLVKPVQEESFIAQVVELIGTSGQVNAAPPVVH
jgi:chemotaxis protein histidine kinase CheA/CheY-like chemotaxis protein